MDKKSKIASRVECTLFMDDSEDVLSVTESFCLLFPFELPEEKILIKSQKATGFHDRKITILRVVLSKTRHTRAMIGHLHDLLGEDQRKLLWRQADSRIDAHLHFFLRLDRKSWIDENKAFLTDEGDCIHVKISLVAFPKNKENILKTLRAWLIEPDSPHNS